MFSKIRARFSSAHVIAGMALFIVLGGSAFAAKNLVTGKEIAKNTVTSKNVKDGTLKTKDLNKKTVASLRGQKGDKGETGANGVVNPQSGSASPMQAITAGNEATVFTKNVPSGSYVVNAVVDLFSNGAGVGECNLLANGDSLDLAQANETAGSTSTRTSLPLVGVAPAGTTTLSVSCGAGATNISASRINLTAIPVG